MKTETTAAPKIVLTLQISATLNAQLIAEAEKEKRSRHSQIIYALEKAFGNEETKKEKRAVN